MAAWLVLACPAEAQTVAQAMVQTVASWRPFVNEASQRFGMPAAWIERVMQAESAGRTMLHGQPIVSKAGAMGLLQLMPPTWEAMRTGLGLGRDPFDPHDNIIAGTAYLRLMYDRFGYPGLFAAYNAGPGRYAAYLAGRQALPGETIGYLRVVTGDPQRPAINTAPRDGSGLFVALGVTVDRPQSADLVGRSDALFVVRR